MAAYTATGKRSISDIRVCPIFENWYAAESVERPNLSQLRARGKESIISGADQRQWHVLPSPEFRRQGKHTAAGQPVRSVRGSHTKDAERPVLLDLKKGS